MLIRKSHLIKIISLKQELSVILKKTYPLEGLNIIENPDMMRKFQCIKCVKQYEKES